MSGSNPKAANMVALNAGAALYAADKVESLKSGVQLAVETIASGAALAKMEELARFSQSFKEA
jgi:anthranilate phosphoribosyltransferase